MREILNAIIYLVKSRGQWQQLPHDSPLPAIIGSQSVKTTEVAASHGFDGHKKIKGRKRHLTTETLGYPSAVKVTDANESGAKYAIGLLEPVLFWYISIQLIWADSAYRGQLADWLHLQYQLDITLNLKHTGFSVIAKRWIVERTFAWISCLRQLDIDYERYSHNTETMLYLASICLILKCAN
jgi:putative transposase